MNDQLESNPRYRIGAVAKMVGVSTHALRAWERRYDALSPERTEAGGRLYTESDVSRLRLIKSLLSYGHSISNVARLPADALSGLLAEHRATSSRDERPESLVRRYLDAIRALDVDGAEQILLRAAAVLPPFEVVQRVVVPVLREVGSAWETGEMCVAQEHASSALVRSHLSGLLRTLRPAKTLTTAIATTPAGELHEFGALMAALLAALRGRRVVYLGPNLPAAEITNAARRSGARLVLLSVISLGAAEAQRELETISADLPANTAAWVGGSGGGSLELPQRFRYLSSLQDLDAALATG